jgi:hypothetical protein
MNHISALACRLKDVILTPSGYNTGLPGISTHICFPFLTAHVFAIDRLCAMDGWMDMLLKEALEGGQADG